MERHAMLSAIATEATVAFNGNWMPWDRQQEPDSVLISGHSPQTRQTVLGMDNTPGPTAFTSKWGSEVRDRLWPRAQAGSSS